METPTKDADPEVDNNHELDDDFSEEFSKLAIKWRREMNLSHEEIEKLRTVLPRDRTLEDVEEHDFDSSYAKLSGALDVIPSISNKYPPVFLDDSRRKYLHTFSKKILKGEKQTSAERMGSQGICDLVLGQKGIGKTYFLRCLQIAVALVTKNVFPVYVDFSEETRSASEILRTRIPELAEQQTIEDIESQLLAMKKAVVFIGDEFHMAYKRTDSTIIKEFYRVGLLETGVIFAILSGSSPYLRNLAYCRAPLVAETRNMFPGYSGTLSLNNERFLVRRLDPIFRNQLKELVQRVSKLKWNEEELDMVYLLTGGVFRRILHLMQNYKENQEIFHQQIEGIVKRGEYPYCAQIWDALLQRHEETLKEGGPSNFNCWIYPPEEILHTQLYNLADQGCIRIEFFDDYSERIYFLYPLQLEYWKSRRQKELSFHEIVSLLFPYGSYGIQAEQLFARQE